MIGAVTNVDNNSIVGMSNDDEHYKKTPILSFVHFVIFSIFGEGVALIIVLVGICGSVVWHWNSSGNYWLQTEDIERNRKRL